jgi:hypothetical protein
MGAAARFSSPVGLATDSRGNVYVADSDTVRKVSPGGVVTTLVGTAGQSSFVGGTLPGLLSSPGFVAVDGSTLYFTTQNGVAVVTGLP